ncbi:hypothetical protein SK128_007423, partial [Halocaridina rubra]
MEKRFKEDKYEASTTWKKKLSNLSTISAIYVKNNNEREICPVHLENECGISAYCLVSALATQSEFSTDLVILENNGVLPECVIEIAKRYSNIFRIEEKSIRLEPNINICEDHISYKGCQNRKSCCDVHICKNYVLGECREEHCVWGHRWDTNHNISVLKKFCMNGLPCDVLQKVFKGKIISAVDGCINVCDKYNTKGCDSKHCTSLHVCLSYLISTMQASLSFCLHPCPRNHNILLPSCISVLARCGISTNESIKDIVCEIFESNRVLAALISNTQSESENLSLHKTYNRSDSVEKEDDSLICRMSKENERIVAQERSNPESHVTSSTTLWSHYLKGNVPIAEICYESVENICELEDNGCPRLHAVSHFHWQVSGPDGIWLNLRSNQVNCLERAYCNPGKNCILLPCLDPSSLDFSCKTLFTLMGRESWCSDFSSMTLCSKSGNYLWVRRICTQKLENVTVKASKFMWYFLDHNNTWIEYGKADSSHSVNLAVTISSDEIETAYIDDPKGVVHFTNSQFNYELNFLLMVQINKISGKIRQVVRRPQPHLQDDGLDDLPQTWNVMLPKQRVQRVILNATSAEYHAVLNLMKNFIFNSVSIERIQNPYSWRAFHNKVKEMTLLYESEMAVDIRYLFHGTSYDAVQNICEENFDWRLHGTVHGLAFGQGTYFTPSAKLASGYAKPDIQGYRYLFVARVAVGTKVLGNSNMRKPPINPLTQKPYDCTVNNVFNPSIFV